MGQACAKSGEEDPGIAGVEHSVATHPDGKAKTFRNRRLSVAQTAEPSQRRRRLSVYGAPSAQPTDPSTPVPPTASCGAHSVAGLEPVPGGAVQKINQDRAIAMWPFAGDSACFVGGVFDGHGRVGEVVSQYVINTLPGVLSAHASLATDPGGALRSAFCEVDRSLAEHCDASVSGTTAVCSIVRGNHIWLANSGDSRAIICRQAPKSNRLVAVDITFDQKPDTPAEMQRILACGGHVTPAGANGSPSRVWHNLRGLAMARSIGDHAAATVGVIAEPEITEHEITDADICMVIASDGVWELVESQEVADLVSEVTDLDPAEICRSIVHKATHMWKVEEGDYRDDITVVVLTFPWLESYEGA